MCNVQFCSFGENIKKEMKFIELAIDNVLTLWVSKSSNIKLPESKCFYPQSGYIKIDVYLLNLVSRISDVKCYDEHVPNTRIIQKTISKHQTERAIRQKQPFTDVLENRCS